jgi:membrane-bound lytic murein transglycosylase A
MHVSEADYFLQELQFADLPFWNEDDPRLLFPVFEAVAAHLQSKKPYKTGALGLEASELLDFLTKAKKADLTSALSARLFFEHNAVPFKIEQQDNKSGFVTGFYEPAIEVSAQKDETYKFPLYRRPSDLIDAKDLPAGHAVDPSFAFARLTENGAEIYADRKEIESGYLNNRGLEIAWAKSKVEVFFVHIQGAARLNFIDGSSQRITYDGKSGHAFSPIGRLLIERGEISRETVSMQTIRDWLIAHPAQADEVMWHNRSFIFFREADVSDANLGPIAAAKVPLVAGRSLAVDKSIHTFGFPFYISVPDLKHLDEGRSFARLMLALDTGSAILGAARGDIFTGSGYEAGEAAGTIKHPADFYILVPKDVAQRYRT